MLRQLRWVRRQEAETLNLGFLKPNWLRTAEKFSMTRKASVTPILVASFSLNARLTSIYLPFVAQLQNNKTNLHFACLLYFFDMSFRFFKIFKFLDISQKFLTKEGGPGDIHICKYWTYSNMCKYSVNPKYYII